MVFPFLDVSGIHNDPLDTLSPRELELLAELGSGRTNAELARNLGVSVNTVKFHLRNLFDKLQVKPRPGRAALARKPRMIRSSPEPVILGIVGDSAAGKTTLTSGIAAILGPDRVACICSDDYHRYGRAERAGSVSPPSTPPPTISTSSSSICACARASRSSSRSTTIATVWRRPAWCRGPTSSSRGSSATTAAPCANATTSSCSSSRPRSCGCAGRRRDTAKRACSREEVLRQIAEREHDTQAFIRPQRTFADIVLTFYPPAGHAEESGPHLNVRHILRPTLPHPDLSRCSTRGQCRPPSGAAARQ